MKLQGGSDSKIRSRIWQKFQPAAGDEKKRYSTVSYTLLQHTSNKLYIERLLIYLGT